MTLQLSGMHCTSCEALVRDILADRGVKTIRADYRKQQVEIEFDPKQVKLEQIKHAIETEGDNYKVM